MLQMGKLRHGGKVNCPRPYRTPDSQSCALTARSYYFHDLPVALVTDPKPVIQSVRVCLSRDCRIGECIESLSSCFCLCPSLSSFIRHARSPVQQIMRDPRCAGCRDPALHAGEGRRRPIMRLELPGGIQADAARTPGVLMLEWECRVPAVLAGSGNRTMALPSLPSSGSCCM